MHFRRLSPSLVLSCLVLYSLTRCTMPEDPRGTLNRVQRGTMRVGVTERQPWVQFVDGAPSGVEVDLLKAFAEKLGSHVDWTRGSESELFEALTRSELDVVAGGITASTPWAHKVALTHPYITVGQDGHVLVIQQGENRWLLRVERFLHGHQKLLRQRYQNARHQNAVDQRLPHQNTVTP